MDPLPGDRLVVRYRLGRGGPADWRTAPGAGRDAAAPNPALAHTPSLSDLTGVLIERTDDELVVERDGATERIPATAITSVRRLSTTTVRNSAIRELERTLTEATPAAERAEVGGWTLSASPAAAGDMRSVPRANAAVPLEFGASTAALADIVAWYLERGLPARVVVPERLLRAADVVAPRTGSGAKPAPPGSEYEVLVGPDGDPVEVPGDDRGERLRLRSLGHRLHHTFTVVDLDPGGST